MSLTRRNDFVIADEVRFEAAAWIARLRDEPRGSGVEADLQEWLCESAEHQRAFQRMTQVWEQAGNIRIRAQTDVSATLSGRSRFSPWAAAAAAALALVIITSLYWRDNAFTTAVGQQRVRLLRDGTRVVMNTDTRIEVNYDEHARRVRLVRGEARFDVSKRPTWPFLVSVGDQEIRALGTSFIVRHDDDQDLSVTLVDGRISVAPVSETKEEPLQILIPGQRLVISRHHAPAVDRPELSRVTAWERGRVEFDATPLEDATAEMNRYTVTRVIVPDAEVAQLRIGGVFRAGDSDGFVKIVTAAFGLRAERNGADIVLSRSKTRHPPTAQ
ncbi:MAG TPA: FecR domain-containing protein [Steroidobacteraceae bacterium]|jgi:transmembrane sensor|nr:FecR domain-containing protein [Steroidobacteraceae bacterium]